MRNSISKILVFFIWGILLCSTIKSDTNLATLRGLVDTTGFAHLAWQMDSLMARIHALNQEDLDRTKQPQGTVWKTAICPHDDYAYVGWLYPAILRNITANTVIIFAVAHKARFFNLENQLVFDSFTAWHGPYGTVKVSALREEIISQLPEEMFIVHDSLHVKVDDLRMGQTAIATPHHWVGYPAIGFK